jgi:hypothetical protein
MFQSVESLSCGIDGTAVGWQPVTIANSIEPIAHMEEALT